VNLYHDTHWLLAGGALLAIGLVSGFGSGLFGVGGGIIRVPIFLALFPALGVDARVAMHVAAGTSLALAVPSSLAAAWRQHRSGNLDASLLRSWVPPQLAGVLLGVALASRLPGHVLASVFGAIMLAVGIRMLLQREDSDRVNGPSRTWLRPPLAFTIGTAATLAGVSGGAMVTPVLSMLGVSIHRAVATATVASLCVSLVGTTGLAMAGREAQGLPPWSLGFVDLPAFAVIAPMVTIAAPLGVRASNALSKRALSLAFGSVLLVVGAYMLLQEMLGLA
jgi:uncharacterized membrane protein YfcA